MRVTADERLTAGVGSDVNVCAEGRTTGVGGAVVRGETAGAGRSEVEVRVVGSSGAE